MAGRDRDEAAAQAVAGSADLGAGCDPGLLYVRARVEYDGTDFYGFQFQSSVRTVQGELEWALAAVTGQAVRIVGAGRTDTGVHAVGQVIAFHTAWRHSLEALERAWGANLPPDIAVWGLEQAPADFHPRFSACRRRYRYTIWNGCRASPLHRRYAWVHPQRLDEEMLAQAAKVFIGEHDFAAFGRPPQGENSVRTVYTATWTRCGESLWFDIEGNAFLQRMVRRLVGVMAQIGRGEKPLAWASEVLASRESARCAPPAPACGLCLMEIGYE